jgi:hypothetical protein
MGDIEASPDSGWPCYCCDVLIPQGDGYYEFKQYGPAESDDLEDRDVQEHIICVSCGSEIEQFVGQLLERRGET